MRARRATFCALFACPLLAASAGAARSLPRYTKEDLRSIAAEGLALCATADSYQALVDAFEGADPYRKKYLALALGKAGDRRAIPLLRAALAETHTPTVLARRPGGNSPAGLILVRDDGKDGTIPVGLQRACAAALDHLGDVSWPDHLLQSVRRENSGKTPAVRLAVFLSRYGTLPKVRERHVADAEAGEILGGAFLDEKLPAADRRLAALAATTIYRKDMSPYGRAYLERLLAKGLPMDPEKLAERDPDTAELARSAFFLLMTGTTRAELGILRECAKVPAWRGKLASTALTSSGDAELFALAVKALAHTGYYGPYEKAYRLRDDVKPEYADFLLAEIADGGYSHRVRDALIMLLAKTGDARALPLVKSRIGGEGAGWAIGRAVEFMPSPEFVEPLFEARRRGWYSAVFSDSCYPLLGTLVALRDKRAIPIVLEHLEGKARHNLGGRWVPDQGSSWYPWQYVRPEAVYEPRSPRRPQVYRYVSVEYLRGLQAKEAIPELRGIVEVCLAAKPSRYDAPSGAKEALVALAALGAPDALDLAARAFPLMPAAARYALLAIDTPAAWEAMTRLCTGTDWEIAILLHERGDDTGVEKVIAAALDPADARHESALDALKRLVDAVRHEKARRALVSLLTRPGHFEDWGDALLVGGYTRLPEVVPALVDAYGKRERWPGNRNKAAFLRAIGRNGGKEAEAFLRKVLAGRGGPASP